MITRWPLFLSAAGAALATTAYARWASSRDPFTVLPQVGTTLPHFDLPMRGGGQVSSRALVGAPSVVVLWSTSCSASRLALLSVQQLYADYRDRGVKVLIVADDDATQLTAFVARTPFRVPVAIAAGRAYTVADPGARIALTATVALPSVLVSDSRGRVVLRTVGVAQSGSSTSSYPFHAIRGVLDSLLAVPR